LNIAGVAQEIPAFFGTKGLSDAPYPAQETWNCALGCLAQQCFEFAECHFDGVQVGRIGWQIKKLRTYRFNRLLNASDFMHRQIVHDDDIAALERWGKALLYISKKHRPIHRAIKHERRRHPALAQTRHESDCLPVSVRRVADQTLAYTVLAASLAYQFGLEWRETRSRSFRFVLIDEAFGRGSDESTRYGMELFRRLSLQLLIVTPLQKIHVIEPYVSAVGFVHNDEGSRSMLRNLTIEEYRAERQARAG
jgi:uncharacterized protein YPO0396